MLSSPSTIVRLSLHILAATVWVGGQFTLAGLVPDLRRGGPEVVKLAARKFARLAWPAYVVLVATGIWNLIADDPAHEQGGWRLVLWCKIGLVALSGVAAFAHQRAGTRRGLAVWGALSSLGAVAALVLGVALAG